MSVPNKFRDELLSAYLDGELTADERASVEQLLQTDSAAQEHLAKLRRLRASLLGLPQQVSRRLPENFASRVVQAAFDEAKREGLSPEHPLRLAAERLLDTDESPRRSGKWQRWGWGILAGAVAASCLFVLTLKMGGDQELAQNDPTEHAAPHQPLAIGSIANVPPPAAPDLAPGADLAPGIAPTDLTNSVASANGSPTTGSSREARASAEMKPAGAPDVPSIANNPALASTTPSSSEDLTPGKTPNDRANNSRVNGNTKQRVQFVLMVEVRLNDAGGDLTPLSSVLQRAGLGKIRDVAVNEQVVQQLASAKIVHEQSPDESEDPNDVQILVIDGMARRLDQALLELLGGVEGIADVGMHMALDSSLTKTTQHVAGLNPVTVQHANDSDAVLRLVGADAQSRWFRASAQGPKFMTPKSGTPPLSLSASQEGADIPATVILLVRKK